MSTAPPRSGQRSTPAVPWHLARPGRPTGRSRQDWCWRRSAAASPLLPVRAPCAPDNTIRFATRALPVLPDRQRRSYTRARVAVQEWLDGSLVGRYQGRTLASRQAPVPPHRCAQASQTRARVQRPAGPAPAAPQRWHAGAGGAPERAGAPQGGTAPPAGHFHWTTTATGPPMIPPLRRETRRLAPLRRRDADSLPRRNGGGPGWGAKTTYTPPGPNAGSRRGACRRTPCAPRRPVLAAGRTRTSPPAPGTARAGAG